jgi:hypothetical protein
MVTAMPRKSIFACLVVALWVAMMGNRAVAAPAYPTLWLPSSASDVRMLANTTTWVGSSWITMTAPGTAADNFMLTSIADEDALTISPASGTIQKGSTTPVKFNFRWSDNTDVGLRSGGITLTDAGGSRETMSVSGAVVNERELTVGSLGITGIVPFRAMAGATLSVAISSGGTAADLDSEATRVNTVPKGKVTGTNITVTYANPAGVLPTFNGQNQSAALDVVFAKPGVSSGALNLAPKLLANGESKTVGGVKVQPVILRYNVAALANRVLTVGRLGTASSSAAWQRVMISGGTTTIGTGAKGPDDYHATRLLAVAGTASNSDLSVYYTGTPAYPEFDSPYQTDALTVQFAHTGVMAGTLDLSGALLTNGEIPSVGATVQAATFGYNVDVLANRTLAVGSLSPARVMVNSIISAQPSIGVLASGPDDAHATRVTAVRNGTASNADVTVTYVSPTASTFITSFNNPGQTDLLNVKFTTTGPHTGSLDLAAGGSSLLANGEVASVGAKLQPAVLSYTNVTAVEQRKLVVGTPTVTFNNVLKGGYVGVTLNSSNANPDANHTTSVVVAPTGAYNGLVMVQATTVSANGVPVFGQLAQYTTGSKTVSQTVAVNTAEAASVGDTKAYPNLTFKYAAGNVGVAALGGTAALGPALTGFVPKGFTLGSFAASPAGNPTYVSMSSRVNPVGTLAGGSTNIYGPVGSEAQILTSTRMAADTTVSMAWRPRSAYESGQTSTPAPGESTLLPAGIKWLTSDVVQVGMSPTPCSGSPIIYAMQMSFDNRINQQLDKGATALDEFNKGSLYLAELTPGGQWQNAVAGDASVGANAQTHVNDSLADFLNQKLASLTSPAAIDGMLQSLVGSWGVDTNQDQAWAIIDHAGTMAVVPEPASLLLLISAGAGLLLYRRRRNLGTGK